MTKAEEVMEALVGHVGTCYCGASLMSEHYGYLTCECGRRWRAEGPPSNSWRRYLLISAGGKKTKYSVTTPSCRP